MKITFLGAAREVTGSSHLLEIGGRQVLVDCGMFQGGADAYRKNRARPPYDPRAIEAVVLTHAHIDHSGWLPKLVQLGFRRRVFATRATCDLLEVMLPDAAFVQEREAEKRRGRHAAPPLYTVADAHAALALLEPVEYDAAVDVVPGLRCRLRDAGHILGSAITEAWASEGGATRKIVFSGDLGQPARPIVKDPTPIADADVLLVESTYGNRLHKSLEQTENELVDIVERTLAQGRGNVVIPAFAVGRTQEILQILADLARRGRIHRRLDVYVDSPMATKATEVTLRHPELIDAETRELIAWGANGAGRALRVHFTESVEDSKRLNSVQRGAIIISASGMCDAGRIRHHLAHNLPRAGSTIVFTGFQAAGTLGRKLVDGAREAMLFGEAIPVRARIATVGGLSAHADQAGLLAWLKGFRAPPRRTFVVHGEASIAFGFAAVISEKLGWRVDVPAAGDRFDFATLGPAPQAAAPVT